MEINDSHIINIAKNETYYLHGENKNTLTVLSNKCFDQTDHINIFTLGPFVKPEISSFVANNSINIGFIWGNDNKLNKLFDKNEHIQECTISALSNEYNSDAIWFQLKHEYNKFQASIHDTNNLKTYLKQISTLDKECNYLHFVCQRFKGRLDIVQSNHSDYIHKTWETKMHKIIVLNNQWHVQSDTFKNYYKIASYNLYNIKTKTKFVLGIAINNNNEATKTMKWKISVKNTIHYCLFHINQINWDEQQERLTKSLNLNFDFVTTNTDKYKPNIDVLESVWGLM